MFLLSVTAICTRCGRREEVSGKFRVTQRLGAAREAKE